MLTNEELRKELNENAPQIVLDEPFKFKRELAISEKTYQYLSVVDNTNDFLSAVATGLASGGIFTVSWWMGLGALSKFILLPLGMVSWPVTGITIAVLAGAGGAYAAKKVIKKTRDASVDIVPKQTTAPIHYLADLYFNFSAPLFIHICYCDCHVCSREKNALKEYFVNRCGYTNTYFEERIEKLIELAPKIDFKLLKKELRSMSQRDKGLSTNEISRSIKDTMIAIARADGHFSAEEQELIKKISRAID